jgi:hypothetical protein
LDRHRHTLRISANATRSGLAADQELRDIAAVSSKSLEINEVGTDK